MSLWSDFLSHQDVHRPVHKWKHYLPVYERYFRDFVCKPLTFLEIGCWKGGSLQIWKRYFGPQATIIGIDINPDCKAFEEDQVHIRIGGQQDTQFLQSILDEFGVPDIILDDGSHVMSHVNATFEFLYPRMAKNGIYLVEDLHTAYWREFGGGLRRADTFIEKAKVLIDELNADHSRGALPPTAFTSSTMAIHFYDSIAVFERCAPQAKGDLIIPSKNSVLDDFIDRVRRLDDQNHLDGLVSLLQFEANPRMLLEATECLLIQSRLRPAYIITMLLDKSGHSQWLIAFTLAVGGVMYQKGEQRQRGLSILPALTDAMDMEQQQTLLQKVIAPVAIPLLVGMVAQKDEERIGHFLIVLAASAPILRALVPNAADINQPGERLAYGHRVLEQLRQN